MIWGKIDDVFYGQSFVTILKLHLYFSMLIKTVKNMNFVSIGCFFYEAEENQVAFISSSVLFFLG